jgi:hypothetical protein
MILFSTSEDLNHGIELLSERVIPHILDLGSGLM